MMTVKVHTYTEEDNTFYSKIKCLKEDKEILDIDKLSKILNNQEIVYIDTESYYWNLKERERFV